MKTKVQYYKTLLALDNSDRELIEKAMLQTQRAYAPYSKFYVGAAVLLKNGEVFVGSNQENASYPLCMCGERIALYNAASSFPNIGIVALAIVAHNPAKRVDKPISPCGACRQVIVEFENRHNQAIRILLKGDADEIMVLDSGKALLPFGFDATYL